VKPITTDSFVTMTQDPLIARKIREARLRDTAARRGFRLTKSRRRDPKAEDYGRYHLTDGQGRSVIGGSSGTDLDTIESYLTGKSMKKHGSIVIDYSVVDSFTFHATKEFYSIMIDALASTLLQPIDEDAEECLLNFFREARQKTRDGGFFDKKVHVKPKIIIKDYCA
jgi:hypothetical protein